MVFNLVLFHYMSWVCSRRILYTPDCSHTAAAADAAAATVPVAAAAAAAAAAEKTVSVYQGQKKYAVPASFR